MHTSTPRFTLLVIGFVFAATLLLGASTAFAQSAEEQELRDTIRAAILSDPRSQGMTPDEVEDMIDALTERAQSVGMTAEDIVWRPMENTGMQTQDSSECGFLCTLNHAFGFDGTSTIPLWLGGAAFMLIFLIGAILEYRHIHHKHMMLAEREKNVGGGQPPVPPAPMQ